MLSSDFCVREGVKLVREKECYFIGFFRQRKDGVMGKYISQRGVVNFFKDTIMIIWWLVLMGIRKEYYYEGKFLKLSGI